MANENYDMSNLNARCMQAYTAKNQPALQINPRLMEDVNFRGEIAQDQFERSGGSGVATVASTAALGGAIGAATGFTLMGNPIEKTKDGLKVKDAFWKTYDKATYNNLLDQEVRLAKDEILSNDFHLWDTQYENIKKLAKAESLESLPEEVRKGLPEKIKTPEEAKELVKQVEQKFKTIDMAKITEKVQQAYEKESVQMASEGLRKFTIFEEKLKSLKPEATAEEIKAFLEENTNLLEETNEKEIAEEIERLSQKSQKELLEYAEFGKKYHNQIITNHTEKIMENVEKESGKLAENASKGITKTFSKFKIAQLQKYGIWGAITGAGAGIAALIIGKDKS